MSFNRSHPCFVFALVACAAVADAQAVDDDIRFVEAMRRQGYFELALEYLDRAANDGAVGPALLKRIAYEKAVTKLQQARSLASAIERERAVASAQRSLEKFLGQTADSELAGEGSARLADAVAEQGRQTTAQAERITDPTAKAERNRRLQDARATFDQARDLYGQATEHFDQALDKLKAVRPGSPDAQRRTRVRLRLASARVMAARALFDKAKTYASGSKTYKKLIDQAAEEFVAQADAYRDWPIGLLAALYEGRCYQANGQHNLAIGCFEEVVVADSETPAYRELVTLGHTYMAASRIADAQHQKAFDEGTAWLRELRLVDAPSATAALKYQVGEAARLLAEGATGSEAKRLRLRARQLLRESGRVTNEFQQDARAKLSALNRQIGEAERPAETFADAYQAGKDAVTVMTVSGLADAGNSQSPAKGIEQEEARQAARDAFRTALLLVDDETPLARVNEARYWLGYLYWESGDYLRTAAVSEYVARSFPDDPVAERCARLALASLERLFNEAQSTSNGDRRNDAFEVVHLQRVAEFIALRWQGDPLADAALSMMLKVALQSGDLTTAREVVAKAPEAGRAALQMKLANALWEKASRQAVAANGDAATVAAAQSTRNSAASLLKESFAKSKPNGNVTITEATSALYLAKALLGEGDARAAIKQLKDKKRGPLTLVDQRHASVDRPGYANETFKTALQAYVSATPPQTKAALNIMDRLEKSAGQDKSLLTRVYFGLGLQLQRQMTDLAATGRSADAARLGKAFSAFLERLSDQSQDADWVTRQWIGQTYLKLGDGLTEQEADDRQSYYRQAASVFESLLDRAAKQPEYAPSANSTLAARMQLGQALRKTEDFAGAIEVFSSLLIERPMMLDVQKAAASTYQDWGAADDADQLITAIRGARILPETGKNLIWGWTKLAGIAGRASRSRPEYKDLFFECWLNVATCRTLAAEKATGATREKHLASAKRTIRSVLRQYPELGGPQRWRQFDRLVRQLQQLAGEPTDGLEAFKS